MPAVMSPWEIGWLIEQICGDLTGPDDPAASQLCARLARFQQHWRALWACFGEHEEGRAAFQAALVALERQLADLTGCLRLTNGLDPVAAIQHWIVSAAVAPAAATQLWRQHNVNLPA
jgi:hypothetical protein